MASNIPPFVILRVFSCIAFLIRLFLVLRACFDCGLLSRGGLIAFGKAMLNTLHANGYFSADCHSLYRATAPHTDCISFGSLQREIRCSQAPRITAGRTMGRPRITSRQRTRVTLGCSLLQRWRVAVAATQDSMAPAASGFE